MKVMECLKFKKQKSDTAYLEKWICGIVLVLAVILYHFVWLDKTFIMAEGWAGFYDALLAQGKIPYRDFYYYLPPFNLVVDHVILKLSFGSFLIYRLWRLLERIVMMVFLYCMICHKVSPYIASVACFAAAVLGAATVHDVIGDYNQTNLVHIVFLIFFMSRYVAAQNSIRRRKVWMFLSGLCGGVMLLSKQPVVLASAMSFAVFFGILIVLKLERNWIQMSLCVILGAMCPVVAALCYLGYHHAVRDFFYQIFIDMSSKGGFYHVLIEKMIRIFQQEWCGICACTCLLCFSYISIHKKKWELVERHFITAGIALATGAGLFLGYGYGWVFIEAMKILWNTRLIILFLTDIFLVFFVLKSMREGWLTNLFFCALYTVLLIVNINGIAFQIYEQTGLFKFLPVALTVVFCFLILWIPYHIWSRRIEQKEPELDRLVMAFGGVAGSYAWAMTNGETGVVSVAAFISIPCLTYIIFKNKPQDGSGFITFHIFHVIVSCIFVVCLSQKLVCAYFWWGDSMASYWEKTETIDIESVKGFKFSPQEKKKYEKLYEVIKANTDENATIWGFPHCKVFNVLLDNYNMNGFVPVPYYDVCADDFAAAEAELLSKNEPDIVVWMDVPDCMEVHEAVYRNGEYCGQREIQKWFSQAKEKDYILIGQVDNVFVYKLDDGKDCITTCIERKSKENTTAVYNIAAPEQEPCGLKGEGTMESPYLISDVKDLKLFRKLVNHGRSFAGEYIRQVSDIDLKSSGNWKPVGLYNSGRLFEGYYDGGGYSVSNLYINDPEGNVGLFGQLAGTVENLAVVDCKIVGTNIGGITSHGLNGNSAIINCFVSGKFHASGRAGGIADNFGGKIINCLAVCTFNGRGLSSGISGYHTNSVINCYSNTGNDISIDDGYFYDADTTDNLNGYVADLNMEREKNGGQMLCFWEIIGGKIRLVHK